MQEWPLARAVHEKATTATACVLSVVPAVNFVESVSMLQKVLTIILNALRRPAATKAVQPQALISTSPPPQPQLANEALSMTSSEPKIPKGPEKPPEAPKPVEAPKPLPEFATFEGALESKLKLLYPPFAQMVRRFIFDARKKGMAVSVFQGLRTFEEQHALYLKGRDPKTLKTIDKKLVVTNAPAGMSMHNYGLAVDIVFDGDEVKPGWQWSWSQKHPWKGLAELGRSHGLEAAYFWKSFPEGPHFEKAYGFTYRELNAFYREGGTAMVWSVLDMRQKIGQSVKA